MDRIVRIEGASEGDLGGKGGGVTDILARVVDVRYLVCLSVVRV
jgi:hypothetical protein